MRFFCGSRWCSPRFRSCLVKFVGAIGTIALIVASPARPVAGAIPLTAIVPGAIARGHIWLVSFEATLSEFVAASQSFCESLRILVIHAATASALVRAATHAHEETLAVSLNAVVPRAGALDLISYGR